jgi:hypothetical protein
MTKRENFEALKKFVVGNEELTSFIDHEIELLDKKSATPKKPTATQIENEKFKTAIVEYLGTVDKPVTVSDIMGIKGFEGLKNQRVTHMLTALRKEGKVARTYVKKVAYFALGTEEIVE